MNALLGNLGGSDQAVIQAAYPGEYVKLTGIGRGSYAQVYKAETADGQVVAIKVIDLKNMQKEIIPYMQNEMKLLSESDNKNVIKLFKSQQTHDKLILVLEFCQLDVEYLVKRYYKGKLPDDLAIIILRQLVNGLCYLHANKIIHRDLKLENFAIHMSNDDQVALQTRNDLSVFERATYKLIDLGLAKKLEDLQSQTSTWAGTELNMAPEILNEQKYSFQADMYSLGVCLYYMLSGKYPYFDPTNRTPLQDLIKKENADFNHIANLQLRSLIIRMLKYDPKQRITFQELYQHEFFKFKEGDLSNPIDLELKENQIIYSQKFDESILDYGQQKQQIEDNQVKFDSKSDVKKVLKEDKQEQMDNYIKDLNSEVFPQIPIQPKNNIPTKIYDNSKKEDDQIMQLYNTRNQYLAILKLADYIEQLIPLVKQSKLSYMSMESTFNMYVEYLRMVSKQIFIKLQHRFSFYQPTLGSYDRYSLLEKQVKGEDKKRLDNITVREGASTGLISWFRKSVMKQIQCEPNDSLDFNKQYEQTNIELYKELLKMLQDSFYKYKDDNDSELKKIKCLIYLSMIDTARSRVLFQVDQKNIDYKIEELLLNKAKEEPDILSEKVTTILGQYNLKYV
ncbi:unnamed protein product (macronuclear) [Paramecium tetraurelia]|uniref:Protein kinase domain-containing protein n=1 Tax=Paramecium tetraurelia TaxID=5888 RepID=A0CS49_PARTE|nr:uncharacterized protein GSPATT00009888001 [Paramecium tetraurelia]CAK73616.1 unnamed protein product [Paramecium tetraurelia]|eukprot:XP_001441013.1 hypothetical protein (macronuclear) [Paramecium tetraurelia strain d4-2]